MAAVTADRQLLFGLLALQNGLIDQGQLVAAFQAWTRNKSRSLADHLVGRGDLDATIDRPSMRLWNATSRSMGVTSRGAWPRCRRAGRPARAWLASRIPMSGVPWPTSAPPRLTRGTTTTGRRL